MPVLVEGVLQALTPAHLVVPPCVHVHNASMTSLERRCTSSRDGKVMLSCWIPEDLREQLDRVWADQGLRPHGRTQKGMENMIKSYLSSIS
jgi:hypothetical protein